MSSTFLMAGVCTLVFGVVDLRIPAIVRSAGAVGRDGPAGPSSGSAAWIVGWSAVRAISQHAIGSRRGDVLVAAWFWILCGVDLTPVLELAR